MRSLLLILLLLLGGIWAFNWRWLGTDETLTQLQQHVSPGKLSAAHASLVRTCAACHTSVRGPEDAKCIACHATNTAVLQRQPSAFHANIGSCAQCHIEHQGSDANLRKMNHATLARVGLARIGLAQLDEQRDTTQASQRADLLNWLSQHPLSATLDVQHPHISALEMTLNCRSCHATKEPHTGLFGTECADCHGTANWVIAQFQHPSANSIDCAQCHQAPPSHYMEHFNMISKPIAGQQDAAVAACCGPAQVNQCYRCHQSTSWDDIKGLGWYKHH